MRKEYTKPILDIALFENADIITLSGITTHTDSPQPSFGKLRISSLNS